MSVALPSMPTVSNYAAIARSRLAAAHHGDFSQVTQKEIRAYRDSPICTGLKAATEKLLRAAERKEAGEKRVAALIAWYDAWSAGGKNPEAIAMDDRVIELMLGEK